MREEGMVRSAGHTHADADDGFARAREAMVATQIEARGVRDPRVLSVLRTVPRHVFVPEELRAVAYGDRPLPIGGGQTISQPYIVARMTEALELSGDERVLEIGTGCGYQTAVLSALAASVYSIEIDADLLVRARATLAALGCTNVQTSVGDGSLGWPEAAPFDAMLIAAAAPRVPAALVLQLALGGGLVMPLGGDDLQELVQFRREADGLRRRSMGAVRFVPLLGDVRREGS
jgi:protein-L-isoaspartate(D-aspartate) O-methyltransferase